MFERSCFCWLQVKGIHSITASQLAWEVNLHLHSGGRAWTEREVRMWSAFLHSVTHILQQTWTCQWVDNLPRQCHLLGTVIKSLSLWGTRHIRTTAQFFPSFCPPMDSRTCSPFISWSSLYFTGPDYCLDITEPSIHFKTLRDILPK